MGQFGDRTPDERKTEDRERMIAMAREAEGYIRRAIYEFKYDHPTGFLVWAFTLEYQFQFRDAERKFSDYLAKVEELEKQLPALAKSKTCDYGFATLRANYYTFQAMSYQQERILITDYQKIADLDRKTIECWEQVIKLKADYALGYSSLALVYESQGKHEAAIEQYENALARETDETKKARIYSGRGSSYASMGRLKEASDDLNQAIKINPEIPLTYWSLASVYERQGKWEDAIAAAEKAISHTKPPTAHSYYFYANLFLRRARLTESDADYEKAIQLANQAISMNSSYASAYFLLASVYKRYKGGAKADEAIVNYELAARYDPNNMLIYFGLGDLYLGIKNNDNAAIQNLTKAVTLKPDFAPAYYELGLAYSHKGDYAEAAKQFQNAIKYDPKYLNAYLELGDLYSQQKNYEEAIKWLLKATEELPTNYLPYKEAARIYSRYQKNEEAIKYYERAIGLVTGDLAWFGDIMKCRITRLRAQYPEAIACFQSVKIPNPEDAAQIPYDVGLTHVANGNKQAARSQYEELKRLKSSLAEDLLKQIDQMK
jgi:tetratricopeptide (TPR) repeat protein